MRRYHAEVIRNGPGWLIDVVDLKQSTTAQHVDEIATATYHLIESTTGLPREQIELVLSSERDTVRTRARHLGFDVVCDSASRTESYQLRRRLVSVRYDDYGAVVDIDASSQVAEFQPTRDGAFEALSYTADYSDARLRRRRRGTC